MTSEQINRAIEEARGITFVGLKKHGLWYRTKAKGYTGNESEAGRYTMEEAKQHEAIHGGDDDVTIHTFKPKNYCGDLNAMHEAEKVLRGSGEIDSQRNKYKKWLWGITAGHTISATAPQRAEAFLRTIGRWIV